MINLQGPYTGVPDPAQNSADASKLVTALSTLVSGQGRVLLADCGIRSGVPTWGK